MNKTLNTAFAVSALMLATTLATSASAQVTFYENEGFRGRVFSTSGEVANFANHGFNDRASSVIVERGRWEVCEDARYEGRCVILVKGSYDSLRSIGMDNRLSSVRAAGRKRDDDWGNYEAPAPMETPNYNWRRRPNERVYSAPVTSARAVMGQNEQRCWMERQQVQQPSSNDRNVGGAILGGILGGVLGHQVGGGRGQDLATAGGAVAGAVIGSNVNRNNNNSTADQDVQRCTTVNSNRPEFWDVTYKFRNVEHRMQMTTAPGATIAVNANGEPRQ